MSPDTLAWPRFIKLLINTSIVNRGCAGVIRHSMSVQLNKVCMRDRKIQSAFKHFNTVSRQAKQNAKLYDHFNRTEISGCSMF